MAKQKTTEVIIVISPRSSEEDMFFTVTIRQGQFMDMMLNVSYGEHVFGNFKANVCAVLNLNANDCDMGFVFGKDDRVGLSTYTATVTDGIFLLH